MNDLDGQRLFFLGQRPKNFEDLYGKNIYWNISALGNIDPAYEIFQHLRIAGQCSHQLDLRRAEKRTSICPATTPTPLTARKAEWPASAASSGRPVAHGG